MEARRCSRIGLAMHLAANDQDRERKIAEFATHYGFRLRFYIKGMCAIFDKSPDGQTAAVGLTASIVAETR